MLSFVSVRMYIFKWIGSKSGDEKRKIKLQYILDIVALPFNELAASKTLTHWNMKEV